MMDAIITGLILMGCGFISIALVIAALYLLEKFQK